MDAVGSLLAWLWLGYIEGRIEEILSAAHTRSHLDHEDPIISTFIDDKECNRRYEFLPYTRMI